MKLTPRRNRSDSAAAALAATQAAALPPLSPPEHIAMPPGAVPFWNAIVQARPRGTWTDVDMASAANLARVQFAIESAAIGSDEHGKLTRLSLALTRAIAVNTTATVGRSADIAKGAELERSARQDTDTSDLIPRLRAVG
jgi:hypothetical protein